MKKYIGILIMLFAFLCILTGCSNDEILNLEDKNIAELEYIEENLVSILSKIINGEYVIETDEENTDEELIAEEVLDWNKILLDTKKIENSLATTIVDLTALNIEAKEIAKLSDDVNNMIVAISDKKEREFLIQLNNVYSLIPTYMEKYAKDKEKTFKKMLKYYTISTYIAYYNGDLGSAKKQSEELEKIYSEKMQDLAYVQNNEYNLNKLYILIQELKRAIDTDNSELVKSKYLLVISEI